MDSQPQILLIGNQGQLGQELETLLINNGATVTGVDRQGLDLTQPEQITQVLQQFQPDLIINCSAYTAVDKAETEPELATQVNAIAPTLLAQEAEKLGAFLIHISTDYVFDGSKNTPYLETDTTAPLGVYGASKQAGEVGILENCSRSVIIRTAWVYGIYGKGNFVKTMLRLGKDRDSLNVVVDQVGSPTWTKDIALAIETIIPHLTPEISGIYHYTNSGVCSWYDFAVAIFEEGKNIGLPLKIKTVNPITSDQYPTPAKRPAYSVLSGKKISHLLGKNSPHWRESLRKMLAEFAKL